MSVEMSDQIIDTSNIKDINHRITHTMTLFRNHARVISEFNARFAKHDVELLTLKIKIKELKAELKAEIMTKLKAEIMTELKAEIVTELKAEIVTELKAEIITELKAEIVTELKVKLKTEIMAELKAELNAKIMAEIFGDND